MKWLRSAVAIGAGVTVGLPLFTLSVSLYVYSMCLYSVSCPVERVPRVAYAAIGAIAGPLSGSETWPFWAAGIGTPGAFVVAGLVAAVLAPWRRLGHATVVGPLVAGAWVMGARPPGDILVVELVFVLVSTLPAFLGGVLGWWLARLRSRPRLRG